MIDYLVVGAGFSGSVCAERLAAAGASVLVVDKRAHIGGNAYDYYDDSGILVHKYGAHIFHTNSRGVFEYLSRFTTWRPYEHRVLSSVNGQLLPVPINLTTLDAFGGDEAAARRAMFEPYTRKQWGPYADELLPSVQGRVRTRDTRDDRYFTDTYQAMPAQGYTRLFERMLDHPNIKMLLNTSYREVIAVFDISLGPLRWDLGTWGQQAADVIYTGPVDEFFGYRFGRLPYRSARFEFVTYEEPQVQPVGVVNYPSEDVAYTRVAEFTHLTGQRHECSTVAYEYPTGDGDPFWPVPTAASAVLYRRYEDLARQTPGVHFCGRLGRFAYMDMHQVVVQALKLSARLLQQEAAA